MKEKQQKLMQKTLKFNKQCKSSKATHGKQQNSFGLNPYDICRGALA